jgi:hypothetical protein
MKRVTEGIAVNECSWEIFPISIGASMTGMVLVMMCIVVNLSCSFLTLLSQQASSSNGSLAVASIVYKVTASGNDCILGYVGGCATIFARFVAMGCIAHGTMYDISGGCCTGFSRTKGWSCAKYSEIVETRRKVSLLSLASDTPLYIGRNE